MHLFFKQLIQNFTVPITNYYLSKTDMKWWHFEHYCWMTYQYQLNDPSLQIVITLPGNLIISKLSPDITRWPILYHQKKIEPFGISVACDVLLPWRQSQNDGTVYFHICIPSTVILRTGILCVLRRIKMMQQYHGLRYQTASKQPVKPITNTIIIIK